MNKPENPPQEAPPARFFVLQHSPGEKWQPDLPPLKQQGLGEHVAYFESQLEAGKLLMGGPFISEPGGMMVLDVATLEEANQIAQADPAVKSGLLQVEVRHWMVPFRKQN